MAILQVYLLFAFSTLALVEMGTNVSSNAKKIKMENTWINQKCLFQVYLD